MREWKVKMNDPPQGSYPVGISPRGAKEFLIRTRDPRGGGRGEGGQGRPLSSVEIRCRIKLG